MSTHTPPRIYVNTNLLQEKKQKNKTIHNSSYRKCRRASRGPPSHSYGVRLASETTKYLTQSFLCTTCSQDYIYRFPKVKWKKNQKSKTKKEHCTNKQEPKQVGRPKARWVREAEGSIIVTSLQQRGGGQRNMGEKKKWIKKAKTNFILFLSHIVLHIKFILYTDIQTSSLTTSDCPAAPYSHLVGKAKLSSTGTGSQSSGESHNHPLTSWSRGFSYQAAFNI